MYYNFYYQFLKQGHDTTKAGISFCLYCLANNQEVQVSFRFNLLILIIFDVI